MDATAWTDAIEENARQLADAARQAGLGAPVPTCPGWDVADLVHHLGGVHQWVAHIIGTRAQSNPDFHGTPPGPAGPLSWFEEGAADLVALLRGVGEADLVWTFRGVAPADFWHRRMAHETVVHRADAEAAAGRATEVAPPGLAVDGIDEYLGMLRSRPRFSPGAFDGIEASYHFHATDTEGEWMLTFAGGQLAVERAHGKADVAVRGPAGRLELLMYNRRGADGLDVLGDAALLGTWRERAGL